MNLRLVVVILRGKRSFTRLNLRLLFEVYYLNLTAWISFALTDAQEEEKNYFLKPSQFGTSSASTDQPPGKNFFPGFQNPTNHHLAADARNEAADPTNHFCSPQYPIYCNNLYFCTFISAFKFYFCAKHFKELLAVYIQHERCFLLSNT